MRIFLDLEIERYTLATGETAIAARAVLETMGVLFCVFTIVPDIWPSSATSGVTIFTFLTGNVNVPLHQEQGARRLGHRACAPHPSFISARARAILQGRG